MIKILSNITNYFSRKKESMSKTTPTQKVKETLCPGCKYNVSVCKKYGVACTTAMEAGYKPSLMFNKNYSKKKEESNV